MDLDLRDRVVVITGGTDGLGLALALTLQREGAKVAVCGRDEDRLAAALSRLGPAALGVRVDVTRHEDLDALVAAVRDRFGRVDGLVNNAGRHAASPVATATAQAWRDDYELKVVAAVELTRRLIDDLVVTGGAVLNVLAIKARTPDAGSTPTAASRAAGLALTKALANELGPRGVRANAILIGLIESGQWERRAAARGVPVAEVYAGLVADQSIPLGRVGRASEFADLAAFLLSPRASYLTGVGVALDGGLSPAI